MKKVLISIIFSACFFGVRAQVSDVDAKLLYQQSEDAYNNKDYYNAAMIAEDLHRKLNAWNPKILFMYLKSVYKNKTDHVTQPGVNHLFADSYKFSTLCVNRCDTLFKLIDKTTYPTEKYRDIQEIQQYFKQAQQSKAYENDRTPAKAIAFLNECEAKFKGDFKLGDDRYPSLMKSASRIYFQLDSPFLKVVSYVEEEAYKYDFKRFYYRVDLIDFSKITTLEIPSLGTKAAYPNGLTRYVNNQKVPDFWYYLNTSQFIHTGRLNKREANSNEQRFATINSDTANVTRSLTGNFNNAFRPLAKASDGNFFMFFNTTSQEFEEGRYFNRILDVMQYLMEYIPDAKTKLEESQGTTSKSGF